MSSTLERPEVRAYLGQLQRLLADSPDREAVMDDITLHIQTATAGAPDDPGLVKQILGELGDPASIAASASSTSHGTAAHPVLRRQIGAIAVVLLLAFGGLAIPAFGWGVADFTLPALFWLVGFVLLWVTKGWTVLDKAVGTFVVPGVFAAAALVEKLVLQSDPTATVDLAVLAGYALLAVAISIYLLMRFRPRAT